MSPLSGAPPGIAARLGPHLSKTTGYILAAAHGCREIRDQEVETIQNRKFQAIDPDDLEDLDPAESWVLAVIVCPGDETEAIARFADALGEEDRQRIRFYWRTGVRPAQALRAWLAADLGPVQDDTVDGWPRFHKLFGAHHAIQVYKDHLSP